MDTKALISGQLKSAGIVTGTRGKPCTALTKPAEDISMLDVYRAVEGSKPLLHLDIHRKISAGSPLRELWEERAPMQ